MEFQVSLTPLAERDLERIGYYIARTDINAAHRFCDELVFVAETLARFPQRHGALAKRPNIRKLPHQAYLIFYKIDEINHTVEILRFCHAARDQHRLRLQEEPSPAYSTSAVIDPALERAHLDVVNRRRREGQSSIIPGDEVLPQARALYGNELRLPRQKKSATKISCVHFAHLQAWRMVLCDPRRNSSENPGAVSGRTFAAST